ncbi:MAG TPA: hypothetical protein VF541_04850 [Longimicrobium sp.]
MKMMRSLLPLAAAFVLAAAGCGDTPVSVRASSLVGDWRTDPVPITLTTPDGQRALVQKQTWSFTANGDYLRRGWLVDEPAGKAYVDFIDEGSFTVPRDGVLELTPRRAFYRAPTQFVTTAEPQPSSGLVQPYGFAVRDGVLSVTPGCPANANCLPPVTVRLHPVPVLVN